MITRALKHIHQSLPSKKLIFFSLILVLAVYFVTLPFAHANDFELVSYHVQSGDTLWSIAQKHHKLIGVGVQEYVYMLLEANEMSDVTIYAGQELFLLASK